MKACFKCGANKAPTEFYRDKTKKDGLSPSCKVCRRPSSDAWGKAHHAEKLESTRRWRELNRERMREVSRVWTEKNSDHLRAKRAEYRKANLGMHAAYAGQRRAALKLRIPDWADLDKIQKIYLAAAELTRLTGIEHQVDHVLPLRGELVSGLHVHQNLQILTAADNKKKFNRWSP